MQEAHDILWDSLRSVMREKGDEIKTEFDMEQLKQYKAFEWLTEFHPFPYTTNKISLFELRFAPFYVKDSGRLMITKKRPYGWRDTNGVLDVIKNKGIKTYVRTNNDRLWSPDPFAPYYMGPDIVVRVILYPSDCPTLFYSEETDRILYPNSAAIHGISSPQNLLFRLFTNANFITRVFLTCVNMQELITFLGLCLDADCHGNHNIHSETEVSLFKYVEERNPHPNTTFFGMKLKGFSCVKN